MRTIYPLMIAVALTAAGPALAQGADNSMDANTTAATTANDTAAAAPADNAATATDTAAVPANDMTAAPVAMDEPPAAPEPAKSFPWGVLGLLGLLGVIGRRRG